MQSNQLVNFANEFDFMPDLAVITISKVLRATAGGSVRGCQGEGRPKSLVGITPSKLGIDLFLGFDQISKCPLFDGAESRWPSRVPAQSRGWGRGAGEGTVPPFHR